uniref:Uncharacterized protein n=1 Tax=Lepeophtheirus salmonis TaxID=72036 RepID=A0A0K2TAL7_LEPSM
MNSLIKTLIFSLVSLKNFAIEIRVFLHDVSIVDISHVVAFIVFRKLSSKKRQKKVRNHLVDSQIRQSHQLPFICYVLPDYPCHIHSSPFLNELHIIKIYTVFYWILYYILLSNILLK